MHRIRRLLFDSCRSNDDDAIIPPLGSRNAPAVSFSSCNRNSNVAREAPAYLWRKDEKWHVVAAYDKAAAGTSARSKIDSHFAEDGILFPSESNEFAIEAEGKAMRESTAVVKRSEDPRRDFRRSMVEMVVEKGMYGADELEELLRCFLSLNSRHHHVAIVAAFADVWKALFSDDSGGCR